MVNKYDGLKVGDILSLNELTEINRNIYNENIEGGTNGQHVSRWKPGNRNCFANR